MNKKRTRELKSIDNLLSIMDDLREACPWDRKQTFESLRHLTIEEVYELSDSLLSNNSDEIKNELGDILLHIVFYSKIASESNLFDISDVANSICKKLVKRHPHVYGKINVKSAAEVKYNWERIKKKEKKDGILSGVPKNLPSLIMALRVQEKASGIGFDWTSTVDVKNKIFEELRELDDEIEKKDAVKIKSELGDLLFSIVNFSRFIGVNPDDALQESNLKFIKRFKFMEELIKKNNIEIDNIKTNDWDKLWNQSKKIYK